MESDLQHHPQQYQQKQMNSGLMRYQSAPSSYFSGFLEREFCEEFLNKPSSPETQRIFAKFLGGNMDNINNNSISNQNLCTIKPHSPVREAAPQVNQQLSTMAPMNDNDNIDNSRLQQQQQLMNNYSSPALQSCYQNQSKPPLPDQKPGSVMNFRPVTSMGMDRLPPMKTGGVNNSNLIRHSSSPAGLFSNISIEFENEYAVLRAVGDFGAVNRETSYSAASSRPHASSGPMSPISEIGGKNISENNAESSGFGESRGDNYVTGFTVGSWDDSVMRPAGGKRLTDEDRSLSGLNAIETQSVGETGIRPLAHHLSLPKTSAEISAIEKFLHLQDSVPCKIRAKRGFATHPRSIAERVRRTRISERMRKLQDLVPNMDKQTNTADMLDLAVDYIKDLQRQVKALSENRKNCRCSTKQEL